MKHQPPFQPPDDVDGAAPYLERVIAWAHERGATDVHFHPTVDGARLWVRVDGELRDLAGYDAAVHARMIARLKVLGRCTDYAGELIQEGRFTLNGGGEVRLSILPTLRGEKAVVRLLASGGRLHELAELGFAPEAVAALRGAVDRPQGLLLAVGPSGCGKSTTLYALLRDLHARAGRPLSVITIEDPIEQSLPLAAQIGAEPARGLGIAEGLRAILRQDPEVIMIGEIRDPETSTAALQAALTGHRLLSSMHTLNAAEALVRLRLMGSPPYVISSALGGVLNLRLVRLLCPDCRRSRALEPAELELLPEAADWPEQTLGEAPGCEACLGSGRRGRTGVGEWLVPTPATAAALQDNQPAAAISGTLKVGAPARSAALKLLREQRIAFDELETLDGMVSAAARRKERPS